MKKALSLFLALTLAVSALLGLASCGGTGDGGKEASAPHSPCSRLSAEDDQYFYFLLNDAGYTDVLCHIMRLAKTPGAEPEQLVSAKRAVGDGISTDSLDLLGTDHGKVYYIEYSNSGNESLVGDIATIRWILPDGSESGTVCSMDSEWYFRNGSSFILNDGKLWFTFEYVELETGKIMPHEIPEYSLFAGEEGLALLETGAVRNLLWMEGAKTYWSTLIPEAPNSDRWTFKVLLDDGKSESEVFSADVAEGDLVRRMPLNGLELLFADAAGSRVYYPNADKGVVNCLDLKTGKITKAAYTELDFSMNLPTVSHSGRFLFICDGLLYQAFPEGGTMQAKFPGGEMNEELQKYADCTEFLLTPCGENGCLIYRLDGSGKQSVLRYDSEQGENDGYTLYMP